MTPLDRVVHYEPRKLQTVRERVQVRHPGTASRPAPPDEDTLAILRSRVRLTEGDEGRIERLARGLSPRELRGVLGGVERWKDLRPWCVRILRHRLSERLLPALWSSWERHPLVEGLQELLLESGERYGWSRVVAAPYVEAVPEWVRAPAANIQRWLDHQGLSFSDVPALHGGPIKPDTPLARVVRDSILTRGSRSQLSSEAPHLLEWEEELAPEDAILFGRNYLEALPLAGWERPVLDRIRDRFGLPRKPKVARFWEPLSGEICQAFQRQYIERRIQEEFGHDDDRERFWRRWANHMVDLDRGRAGSVRYADIDFGGFVVIEFFETGNAAYFYHPEDARAIREVKVRAPRDLKRKRFYGIGRGDNRLIHSPRYRWHVKGDQMMRRWIRRLG